jgi:hypothetical protein
MTTAWSHCPGFRRRDAHYIAALQETYLAK